MFLFRHWSVSRKILLGILPLFLIFIALSVAVNNYYQERQIMEQAQVAAHTYAEIIRESLVSMMVNNLEVDNDFLARATQLHPFDTLHIIVNNLRLRPEVLADKGITHGTGRFRTLVPHDTIEHEVLRSGEPRFGRMGDKFRGVVPFNATAVCQKCHAVPVGYTLGAVDLHISFSQISSAAKDNWTRSFLIFVGFTIVATGIASVLFRQFVSRPVDTLVKATAEISKGNLEHAIAHDKEHAAESRDELEFLSSQFDAMRVSLKEKIEQLDEVNKNLAERNEQLEQALERLKEAQKELLKSERLAATGKMTAQLSHEINNPIHNIQSLLESSLRKVDGPAHELVTLALEEVTRMSSLTRQMLDFYRGSIVEFEKGPVDVPDLVAHLLKEHHETLTERGITTLIETSPAVAHVLGSRDKLKQVFLNLILNARDAMPNGGTLTFRILNGKGNVRVSVSDTGIGIPPENLARIFDAFFTTKKEVSGVGLGLSVTYGIIQQHGGTIRVTSTPGSETAFIIELPSVRPLND